MGAGSHVPDSFGTGKALSLRGLILEIVPPTSAHTDGWCLAITELMARALDALRCAVVLTNEQGTILHANRAGERMLPEGGPIQSSQGILQATAPSAASELRSALSLAARNEAGIGKTGLAIRLTPPDVPPFLAHVLPLTGSDFRTQLQPTAVAAVFIGAPPDAQDGADGVAAAFGLTPAETKVLASLFGGRTLNETAVTLGITRPTAKTHLEHIFLKTGVTRQAELMRLWTGLISPTGLKM
jgi:DNA-binding CsgD family transcriptional regulator